MAASPVAGPTRISIGWPRHTGVSRWIRSRRQETQLVLHGTSAGPHSSRMYWRPIVSTITEFSIGASKTINLGNFQSLRIEASVTVAMDPGETLADASAAAQSELRNLLEQTYREQYKQAQSLL